MNQSTRIKSSLNLTNAQQRFIRGHRDTGRFFLLDVHGNLVMMDLGEKNLRDLGNHIFHYVEQK